MSTAILIRLEALERRVSELERRVAEPEERQTPITAMANLDEEEPIAHPSPSQISYGRYAIKRGGRGRFFVWDGDVRVSGGMSEEDARRHALDLLRGHAEVAKMELA